jgi:hypothetical protein
VTRPKQRGIPRPEDLPEILNDEFIERTTREAMPWAANRKKFAATLLPAAERYATTMAIPSETAMRNEISALYRAADQRRYKEVARRVGQLTKETRAYIEKRGKLINLAIPNPEVFADPDPERRNDACDIVATLLRRGMERGGEVILHAPTPRRPRRQAELDLIMWIEVAYLEATGMKPTLTADPKRPGPFARMVKAILKKIAPDADAIGLLNELQRPPQKRQHRKKWQRQYQEERRQQKTRAAPKT